MEKFLVNVLCKTGVGVIIYFGIKVKNTFVRIACYTAAFVLMDIWKKL